MTTARAILALAALAIGVLGGCAQPGARPWRHHVGIRNESPAGLPPAFDPDP